MINSIGVDIVDISRFGSIVGKRGNAFINKILTVREIDYCKDKSSYISSMAARFAAKEAFIKCIPPDAGVAFRWKEIEIINLPNGRPQIILNGGLKEFFKDNSILLSLSHSRSSAVAMVVIQ